MGEVLGLASLGSQPMSCPQLDRSTKEVELGLDYGTPTMNLAGQSLKFENGQWIAETGISGGVAWRELSSSAGGTSRWRKKTIS